jgi:RimJ/RimL family protein N-acetyltransferase
VLELRLSKMKITDRENRLPIIETRRLVFRDIRIEDISDAYIAWVNNPETTRYLEIRFQELTLNKIKEFIQSRLDNITTIKHFGIYDQNGTRLVGNISANINIHHKSADISYVIGHPEANGKGYATEAVHSIVYYLFNHCDIEQIWAGYYEGHEGSARVLQKNGFSIQGRVKKQLINHTGKRVDHIYVGLLPEDFQPDENLLGKLPVEIY